MYRRSAIKNGLALMGFLNTELYSDFRDGFRSNTGGLSQLPYISKDDPWPTSRYDYKQSLYHPISAPATDLTEEWRTDVGRPSSWVTEGGAPVVGDDNVYIGSGGTTEPGSTGQRPILYIMERGGGEIVETVDVRVGEKSEILAGQDITLTNDHIYMTISFGENISAYGPTDAYLYKLSRGDFGVVWKQRLGDHVYATAPIVYDDVVIVGSYGGSSIKFLDRSTGEITHTKSENMVSSRGLHFSIPEEKLYYVGSKIRHPYPASIGVQDYHKDLDSLVELDWDDWDFTATLDDEAFYMVSDIAIQKCSMDLTELWVSGYRLDYFTGLTVRGADIDSHILTEPIPTSDSIILGLVSTLEITHGAFDIKSTAGKFQVDTKLISINKKDGRIQWKNDLERPLLNISASSEVVYATYENELFVFRTSDGRQINQYSFDRDIVKPPVFTEGSIYIHLEDGGDGSEYQLVSLSGGPASDIPS